jgi:hypothetical protein
MPLFSTYFGANLDLAIQDLLVTWNGLLASTCVLCVWTSFLTALFWNPPSSILIT